ncbi:MAG: pilus assembly protein PilP [Gammaproteobacteria bacterium]|nr:pilus assembly protein PilP [Gammaproteobacteria bacterium]
MTNLGSKNSAQITYARLLYRLSSIFLVFSLAACSSDMTDLTAFVEKAKATKSSHVAPLPEIKPHETFNYQATQLRNPFEPFAAKRPRPIGQKGGGTGKGPKPIPGRPREALEAFSLDTLRMVGTLEQGEGKWALVKASDGTIHRVTPGNYLGQNHGKIVIITEDKIELTEIAPDGLGDWMERPATMALSE